MDDAALVAAMVAADPRGLEGAYRRYADRLYTYCRGLLRDDAAAADAVHDTFIAANAHAGDLREPERLRAWLYAIARNECLRQLRARARQVPLEDAGEVSAPVDEPDAGVRAETVRELVWAAAAGLNPGDGQVFELMVRHGLSAPDVASVLGVSPDHAHARLSRARAQLERALGALLVARTGAGVCADLAAVLGGWDGTLTVLLRKRISRHVESCDTCGERQRRELRPAALLSAYAGLPFLVAPAALWPRIHLTSASVSSAGVSSTGAAGGGSGGTGGGGSGGSGGAGHGGSGGTGGTGPGGAGHGSGGGGGSGGEGHGGSGGTGDGGPGGAGHGGGGSGAGSGGSGGGGATNAPAIADRMGPIDPATGFPVPVAELPSPPEAWDADDEAPEFASAGPLGPPPDQHRVNRALATAAGLLAVLLVFLGSYAFFRSRQPRLAAAPAPAVSAPESGAVTPTPRQSATATRAASPSPSATVTASAPAPPPAPSSTGRPSGSASPSAPALTVRASGQASCVFGIAGGPYFTIKVTAYASADLTGATLYWSTVSATGLPGTGQQPLTVDGTVATGQGGGTAGSSITWWVQVVDGAGRTARSTPVTAPDPCG